MVIKALGPDWIRIGIQPKMLDPDTDPDEMVADPQPWMLLALCFSESLRAHEAGKAGGEGAEPAVPPLVGGVQGGGGGTGQQGPGQALRSMPPLLR